jgi:uncharacterized protein (TIGR02466 family)
MQVSALFPTPLVASILDGSGDLCADLRRIILAREAANEGAQHSNSGGWQSADDLLDWAGRSGGTLVAAIREVADHFTAVLRDDKLERLRIDWKVNAWANVNRSGAANALHYHPGAYWSAVFYVDDGGIGGEEALGGAIEFIDPRGPLPMMHAPSVKMTMSGCGTAGLGERVYPKTGLLVMFPAWLGHRVTPYSGAGTRISVAMNFAA